MTIDALSGQLLDEFRSVFSNIKEEDFLRLEGEILQPAKAIFVTAAGRSAILMRPFAMRLMQFGLESYVVGETTTPKIKPDDLLIVTSGSGQTEGVVRRAKEAHDLGARVFVITSATTSPLLNYANHSLILPPPEKGTFQLGTIYFEQVMFLLLELINHKIGASKGITLEDIKLRHANFE